MVGAPIKLGGIQFQAMGAYNFFVEVEGHREPIITEFEVALNLSQPVMLPPR